MQNSLEGKCPKTNQDLRRVLGECEKWGVTILFVPKVREPWQSPFCDEVGLSFVRNTIYVAEHYKDNPKVGSDILHEMSHLIQNVHPDLVSLDEVTSGMLAVEYEAAKRLKLGHWEDWMSVYQISAADAYGSYIGWDIATDEDKAVSLKASRKAATKKGLLDGKGCPTYRRAKTKKTSAMPLRTSASRIQWSESVP